MLWFMKYMLQELQLAVGWVRNAFIMLGKMTFVFYRPVSCTPCTDKIAFLEKIC